MRHTLIFGTALLALVACSATAQQPAAPQRPVFDADGTVHVPAFDLPPSPFLSPEALEAQKSRAKTPGVAPNTRSADIAQVRAGLEAQMAPQVAEMLRRYSVDIAEQRIGGVRTRVITPQGSTYESGRVLINLHGGGFTMCADACALLESVPISALGKYKVVTVDYRQAPEAKHPAALEDLEKVYRELLKDHEASGIGIYGCSAGGALTGQAAAWLPARGLPQPGAIGIFGAGAVRFGAGDSAYISGYISGAFPPPAQPGAPRAEMSNYFHGADLGDKILSPVMHPEVAAKFPPTLVITGTRAMDLTPAVVTNAKLLAAGAKSTLLVAEGMDHCYIYQANLPEARDAYKVTVDFFRANLR